MTPPLHSIVSRLHLKQLRLLVALGEHGSLLKASQQVALTQPGASKALQEIETTFGTPLFVRTNRGLEPNAVGHCVIRYARLIQTDLAHLRDEIVGIMRGQGGRVAAGVIMGAVPLLTDAISALVARQADLSVEIVEDTSAALLAQLDAGRLDLAICRTTISQAPQVYDSVKLQDETLAVIANVGHPLRHATPAPPIATLTKTSPHSQEQIPRDGSHDAQTTGEIAYYPHPSIAEQFEIIAA
ncbi:DNA-binding transcriptional LysR family regulator [Mesorhizobium robiniae]|uniref:DNA-binding transcriptional LysR family regulator n=1 Tax=Mesorhizobium robiniae TaxID=559315 RepID=A0ABV2GWF9_9HYPH